MTGDRGIKIAAKPVADSRGGHIELSLKGIQMIRAQRCMPRTSVETG